MTTSTLGPGGPVVSRIGLGLLEPSVAVAALTLSQLPGLSLAEAPDAYWAERAARPWH